MGQNHNSDPDCWVHIVLASVEPPSGCEEEASFEPPPPEELLELPVEEPPPPEELLDPLTEEPPSGAARSPPQDASTVRNSAPMILFMRRIVPFVRTRGKCPPTWPAQTDDHDLLAAASSPREKHSRPTALPRQGATLDGISGGCLPSAPSPPRLCRLSIQPMVYWSFRGSAAVA
jgi:hypothetical protein